MDSRVRFLLLVWASGFPLVNSRGKNSNSEVLRQTITVLDVLRDQIPQRVKNEILFNKILQNYIANSRQK